MRGLEPPRPCGHKLLRPALRRLAPPQPAVRHVNLIRNWFEELNAEVTTTR
jgi:hypothetical protein